MIRIRSAQMQAFAEDLYRRFRASVIDGILAAARTRGEVLDAATAGAAVDGALARAAEHGIVARDDLYKLGDLIVALGTEFDMDARIPWAGFLLRHRELAPGVKLDLIAAKAAETRRTGEAAGR